MAEYLFPNFLRDAGEYDRAAQFWRQRWTDLIPRFGEGTLWETPWLATKFADGTPCRDGNPIFSAVSYSRKLGVRIIQVEPHNNPRELAFWTDRLGDGQEAVTELVVACVLTPQNVTHAIDLMTQWITTGHVEVRHGYRAATAFVVGDQSEILFGSTVGSPSGPRSPLVLN